jgi:hypothetical protein
VECVLGIVLIHLILRRRDPTHGGSVPLPTWKGRHVSESEDAHSKKTEVWEYHQDNTVKPTTAGVDVKAFPPTPQTPPPTEDR